jgi:hypothetical protein
MITLVLNKLYAKLKPTPKDTSAWVKMLRKEDMH